MKSFSFPVILVLILSLSLTIEFVSADGIIIPDPVPGLEKHPDLAIKYHHVNITIIDQYAKTQVDQVFLNELNRELEGTYIFPLPEDASISRFSMYVDGEELAGKILEKDEANKIYENIVRQLKDPAILEYVGRDMFKARVYPIPARKDDVLGEKQISLTYEELVNCDSGVCRYVYPLDTERFSSRPLESVLVTVRLKSDKPIKAVYSPTHEISVKRIDDHNTEVSYEATDVLPEKDFVLYYTLSEKDFGLDLLTYKKDEGKGFFMLLVAPKYGQQTIISKDIVFVIDSSGSMSGEKISQAKDAMEFCVSNLNDGDRFNVVSFNSYVEKFSDEPVLANPENIKDALDFIGGIESNGGTNINEALLEALEMMNDDKNPNMIVFLTDGLPTVGVTEADRILSNVADANTHNTRIFVFGVGYDVNTHLLDQVSGINKGVSEYVEEREDIEVKVSAFYTKIQNPVLSDLGLDFSGITVEDMYPKELPDLFKGSQLTIFGRYSGSGGSLVELTGRVGGDEESSTYEVSFPQKDIENEFIPRLWAMRKIGYLLDEIRLNGEEKEVIDEIIELSIEYGIMTPYTSFLVDVDTYGGEPVRIEETRNLLYDALNSWAFKASTGEDAVQSAENMQK